VIIYIIAYLYTRMRQYSSDLVVQMLRKEYPEIENKIRLRLDTEIPDKLVNLNYLPAIINSFKAIKGVNYKSWTNSVGGPRNEMIENRELLLAVIMLFYQPEKIMNLTTAKVKYNLTIRIAEELGCKESLINAALNSVLVIFKAYKSFKEEAYRVYELIKLENKFF
jgi:hypothetical protein